MKRLIITTIALTAAMVAAANQYGPVNVHTQLSSFDAGFDTLAELNGYVYAAGYRKTSATDGELSLMCKSASGQYQWMAGIPTDGTGTNRSVKLLAADNRLYLAANVYEVINGLNMPCIFIARIDPDDGQVNWSHIVPNASAAWAAISGTGASLRVMAVGSEFNPGLLSSRYIAASVDANGDNPKTFASASWDYSKATSVAGLGDGSFAIAVVPTNGQAFVRSADGPNPAWWSTSLGSLGSWASMRLCSGNPAETPDGVGLVAVGLINDGEKRVIGVRMAPNGPVVNWYKSPPAADRTPVHPVWRKGKAYTSVAFPVLPLEQIAVMTVDAAGATYGNIELANPGAMAAIAVDAFGVATLGYAAPDSQGAALEESLGCSRQMTMHYESNLLNSSHRDLLFSSTGILYTAERWESSPQIMARFAGYWPIPKAFGATVDVPYDTAKQVSAQTLLANDFGAMGASIVFGTPGQGMLTPDGDGGFAYTPDAGFIGIVNTTYKIMNPLGQSTAALTIRVFPKIQSLSLSANSVPGGYPLTGTVTMNGPMPTDQLVSITDNSAAASVPPTVQVALGAASKSFAITTSPLTSDQNCVVTAKYRGISWAKSFTIVAPKLKALALSSGTVVGGSGFTGTVALTGKAPAAGIKVTLSHSGAEIGHPAWATVAENQSTTNFQGTTLAVATTAIRSVSASFNGVTKTVTLTITP